MRFSGESAAQAASTVAEALPEVFGQPDGGLRTPAGSRVSRFESEHSAEVELAGGKNALVESSAPLDRETAPGQRQPIDLALHAAGSSFEPDLAATPLRIPAHLADGVQMPSLGVSLTPIASSGQPLEGSEGVLEGWSVFYANTQTDTDTAVKPLTEGVETDSILRSEASPEQLAYHVSLPTGAELQTQAGVAITDIVLAGQVIAVMPAPTARDAEGTSVPVSTSWSGTTLVVTVQHRGGGFRYPIDVDPTMGDSKFAYLDTFSNWFFATNAPEIFYTGGKNAMIVNSAKQKYTHKDFAEFAYRTQGASHIGEYEVDWFVLEPGGKRAPVELQLLIGSPRDEEEGGPVVLSKDGEGGHETSGVCVASPCNTFGTVTEADENNEAFFEVHPVEESEAPMEDTFTEETVWIVQEREPTTHYDTTDATLDGSPNAAYAGSWTQSGPSAKSVIGLDAYDPGVGIDRVHLHGPGGWKALEEFSARDACAGDQCNECHEHECPSNEVGGANVKSEPYIFKMDSMGSLPEGEDTVEAEVWDPIFEGVTKSTVKVDNVPPTITVSGLPAQFTEPEAHLVVSVKDGTTVTSSGVRSAKVSIDGREVPPSIGGCAGQGPCTVTGEYTLVAANLGAGQHTLKVEAEDKAGNKETRSETFYVHHASPMPIGPGVVDPQSGEARLSATDVSVAGAGASLTVQRAYRSDALSAGNEGPLGGQWTLSVGGQESITTLPNGNATLVAASGGQTTFIAGVEGKYTAPNGDASLALSEAKNGKGERTEYVLRDPANGVTTSFTSATGPTGTLWKPTKQEGPIPAQAVRYLYQSSEGVTEPRYALAPEPAGLSYSCITKLEKAEKLEKGCRALEFKYASATTATGEKETEWKEYKGRLNQVVLIAYNPATKAMAETPLAQYAYDTKGRLRAVWNPQISPNVKTMYGYDAEGHVTAVTPAGQQPWLLHYGTVAHTAGGAYLLSVMRPSAVTKREPKNASPAASVVPTLSSSKPAVGSKISVSANGTWSNTPLAYSYQWERCSATGGECAPIVGAVNQAYYPVHADEGHELTAQVIAFNGNGAGTSSATATAAVAAGTEGTPPPEPPAPGSLAITTIDYGVPLSGAELQNLTAAETERWGQSDNPVEATAIFPPDTPMGWPAREYKRATVLYFDSSGRTVNTVTPNGGVATSEYNSLNDPIRLLSPDNRATALHETCESEAKCKSAELAKLLDTKNTYEEKGEEPGTELLETVGPQHTVKLESTGEVVAAREKTHYSYDENAPAKGGPYQLVTRKQEEASTAKGNADARATQYSYSGQENLGWTLRKPTAVTVEPGSLDLTHSYVYEKATGALKETSSPAGVTASTTLNYLLTFGSTGHETGELEKPMSSAVDSSGEVLVVDDENHRVEKFSSTGSYLATYGKYGSSETELEFEHPIGIALNQSTNDVYVSDESTKHVDEFSASTGKLIRIIGKAGSKGGEFGEPQGVALDGKGHLWVVDSANNRIEEFNEEGIYIKTVGEKGTACGDFTKPEDVAISGETMYVTDTGNSRVEKFTEEGKTCTEFGSAGKGSGQFKEPAGVAVGPTGHPFVVDEGNTRIEEFTATGGYLATYGAKGTGPGELSEPTGITILSSGVMYVTDASTANRVEKWGPTANGARTTQTYGYTAGSESEIPTCRSHPEWAGLPCQIQPANQPETGGMPNLPVTTYTYNMFDEPETTTETVEITKTESKTRTKTSTYDAAGRPKTEAITSTVGTALPTVTDTFNAETGALEKLSTTGKTITSIENTLGQLESYTDADENKATYEYDVDGRTKKTNDGKGTQTYTYNEAGQVSELVDSSHEGMKFTATYDAEGNILTEGYPNGMTATYTYNAVGKPTALEYKKITHCTEEKEKCVWFKDTVEPSIHDQWLEQTSTLSHQAYAYDNAGRLTQVQNTPAGKGCTTRIYAYDEDTNRLNLTTREPNTKGECASEGTSSETHEPHLYDSADRLADPGVSYNTFGDITALPPADAGGGNLDELTNTYYVDNQLASQTQEGQTIGYNLDPAGRTRELVYTGKKITDVINHYAGPEDSPAWTKSSSEWTRNIPGITGSLSAIQNNGETPVLQLTNLHGDIIATAYLSETATALASTADTSEYGVPAVSAPPKYSWLGASEIPTELPSGVIAMGLRSYVPQLGRFLQPDPDAGGSANAYAYTFGDPVNSSDPTGAYTITLNSFDITHAEEQGERVEDNYLAEKRAAEEAAARQAAEEAAERAAELAAAAGGPQYAAAEEWGEEEWEEWSEEEGEYEYASNHQGGESGGEEHHIESGVLYQPLGGEAASEGSTAGPTTPLCEAVAEGPCAHSVPCDKCRGHQSKCNTTGQHCSGKRGHPHQSSDEGSENLHKACILLFWTPYGLICGAYEAGRYVGQHG
jgi:RHS repeat-associated protein